VKTWALMVIETSAYLGITHETDGETIAMIFVYRVALLLVLLGCLDYITVGLVLL